jgi:hypothetical protein
MARRVRTGVEKCIVAFGVEGAEAIGSKRKKGFLSNE